jgi:hypothetical protein
VLVFRKYSCGKNLSTREKPVDACRRDCQPPRPFSSHMTSLLRSVRRLLRRLVESLPPIPGPWTPVSDQETDLVDFQDFTDEEIDALREVLHSSGDDPQLAIEVVGEDTLFPSSSDSGDEWDGDGLFTHL